MFFHRKNELYKYFTNSNCSLFRLLQRFKRRRKKENEKTIKKFMGIFNVSPHYEQNIRRSNIIIIFLKKNFVSQITSRETKLIKMGKKNKYFFQRQSFGECLLCDYKSSSKKGLILHMKYSHPEVKNIKTNDDPVVQCGICKKKDCKIH